MGVLPPLDYQKAPRPRGRIANLVSLSIALTLRFIFFNWLSASIMLSDSGTWRRPRTWAAGVIVVGAPFLFSMWWIYRCFCTDEMYAINVLGCEVRPKALLRAVLADVCLVGLMFALWAILALLLGP